MSVKEVTSPVARLTAQMSPNYVHKKLNKEVSTRAKSLMPVSTDDLIPDLHQKSGH